MSRPVKSLKKDPNDSILNRILKETASQTPRKGVYTDSMHYTELMEINQKVGMLTMMCIRLLASNESVPGQSPGTKELPINYSRYENNGHNIGKAINHIAGSNEKKDQGKYRPTTVSAFIQEQLSGDACIWDLDASFPIHISEETTETIKTTLENVLASIESKEIKNKMLVRQLFELTTVVLERSILTKLK